MALIECKEVCKSFGAKVALDHVNLDFHEGRITGLLGPNGAGKTTLIRIINRITIPSGGEILFRGKPITQQDVARIGYMPEERGLYRKMKVGEQALYLARLKGMSRNDAIAALKDWFVRFGIQDWWGKKVEELSKGMAQKLQFITTVVHKPALMILDEPFSGFDPVNADLVRKEIIRLRDEGATIILSTHDMGSVEELCNDIALINRSHLVISGDVQEIRRRYEKGLIMANADTLNNERQIGLALQAEQSMQDAVAALEAGMELDVVTIDLENSWTALKEITGKAGREDLLDEIFSRFCLGK